MAGVMDGCRLAPGTNAGIWYRPPGLVCRSNWSGRFPGDGSRDGFSNELGTTAAWLLGDETGAAIAVNREGDEINGFVFDGAAWRVAWDTGSFTGVPTMKSGDLVPDWARRPVTPVELRVMVEILVPLAREWSWSDLMAEATPCDHTDRWCARRASGPDQIGWW